MPCWRCQSTLTELEHVQATGWGLCPRCLEDLRPKPKSSDVEAPADPGIRTVAIYTEGGRLLLVVADNSEIGCLMLALSRAAGESRRLVLREIDG